MTSFVTSAGAVERHRTCRDRRRVVRAVRIREEGAEEDGRHVKAAITLDTGALIALERGDQRMGRVFVHARAQCIPMFAPADAVAEWWRGRTDVRETLLRALVVEPLSLHIAMIAAKRWQR